MRKEVRMAKETKALGKLPPGGAKPCPTCGKALDGLPYCQAGKCMKCCSDQCAHRVYHVLTSTY